MHLHGNGAQSSPFPRRRPSLIGPSPGRAALDATQRLGRRIAEARLGAMQGGEREPSRQVMRAASRRLAKHRRAA